MFAAIVRSRRYEGKRKMRGIYGDVGTALEGQVPMYICR